jgi:hypothetical protein
VFVISNPLHSMLFHHKVQALRATCFYCSMARYKIIV